jgi:hypothetical protein
MFKKQRVSPRIFVIYGTVNFTFHYCESFFKANLNQHEDLSNEIDSEALPVGKFIKFS